MARALVRTNGYMQRTVFSDSEGHFQIEGLPAGRVNLTAQKPGYVNQQDSSAYSPAWVEVGANTGAVSLKLVPQSAIYGRVTDASGQPLEHVPLRLNSRNVREGHKHWESRGMTESDEDGHFRFANLMPGTYYLAAGPSYVETRLLPAGEKPKAGFPSVYYPGVSDLASASPIQLTAGQQSQADFSLSAVPVYQLAGSVVGNFGEQGVGFQVLNQSGDEISLPATFNMANRTFMVESVPPGSYILKAVSYAGTQALRAEMHLNVASSQDNLRLVLAPAISIPVIVRMESRGSSSPSAPSWSQGRPPVSVRLIPNDATSQESYSTFEQRGSGQDVMVLQNVDAGIYTADVMPQPPWYVQSASYAQANLLTDDISVTAAGQSYPMEIVLRDDSATLSGTVKNSEGPESRTTVVVVPQSASKLSPRVVQGVANDFSVPGLAPGEYMVYAFDRVDGMEYSNADVLQPYSSQAAHVSLSANQQVHIVLDQIHVGKGD